MTEGVNNNFEKRRKRIVDKKEERKEIKNKRKVLNGRSENK